MKYRIKNLEVENAIRGMFKDQSEFEFILNAVCVGQMGDTENYLRFVVNSERSVTGEMVSVDIKKSDIETTDEYNPKVWNEYPKVTPPKDDYYRVQMTMPDFEVKRFMLEWRDRKWRVDYLPEHRELLFKPWDDEENKNESN